MFNFGYDVREKGIPESYLKRNSWKININMLKYIKKLVSDTSMIICYLAVLLEWCLLHVRHLSGAAFFIGGFWLITLKMPTHKDWEKYDLDRQFYKFLEEVDELGIELLNLKIGEIEKDKIAGEYFDVVQAGLGLLKKLGIDIEEANRDHIEKLKGRGVVDECW